MIWGPRRELEEELAYYREDLARHEREFLVGVVIPEPYTVRLTCVDVPEQWDILIDGRQVGYLRCRHSKWRLDYLDVGGKTLIAEPWHPERGQYESSFDEERPQVFARVFRALDHELMAR